MRYKCILRCWNIYLPMIAVLAIVTGAGCGSELKYRLVGPIGDKDCLVGPLRIDVAPVDTDKLGKDHPFRWRRSKMAGFLLFDIKITNTGKRDLLCQLGHLDFPGLVAPRLTLGNFLDGAMSALQSQGQSELIGTDDLRLTALPHEKATILMADGYRYQILSYSDFSERYMYLMQKEMRKAQGLAFIPYVGGFIALAKIHDAAERRPERLMQAQQMVMRPGVVPAGTTVRGYLVFAWPPDVQPCSCTLRLPVQPGHVASLPFDISATDQTADRGP